jgi:hypothetical protein
LIHNLNYRSPFPIDQDFYVSPTFQVQNYFEWFNILNKFRVKYSFFKYRNNKSMHIVILWSSKSNCRTSANILVQKHSWLLLSIRFETLIVKIFVLILFN